MPINLSDAQDNRSLGSIWTSQPAGSRVRTKHGEAAFSQCVVLRWNQLLGRSQIYPKFGHLKVQTKTLVSFPLTLSTFSLYFPLLLNYLYIYVSPVFYSVDTQLDSFEFVQLQVSVLTPKLQVTSFSFIRPTTVHLQSSIQFYSIFICTPLLTMDIVYKSP